MKRCTDQKEIKKKGSLNFGGLIVSFPQQPLFPLFPGIDFAF